jgi:hypothetical protein
VAVIRELESDTILEIASGVVQVNMGVDRIIQTLAQTSMCFRCLADIKRRDGNG